MSHREAGPIPDEAALGVISRLGRDALDGEVAPAAHDRGKRKLIAALDGGSAPARSKRPFVALAAAAALAAAVVIAWPRPGLRYEVDGVTAEGGYVRVPAGGAAATVRFSDGSTVVLAAGGRGRIADVGRRGARVLLESGKAHVHIAHVPRAEWSVEAGPFTVLVTGTEFDVAWKAEEGELEVRLAVGSVVVKGPLSPDGVAMHAGQRLTAKLGDRELRIVEGSDAPAPSASAASSASASSAASAPLPEAAVSSSPVDVARSPLRGHPAITREAPSAARVERPAPPSWSSRVKSGDFAAVLSEAESRGLAATLAQAPLADLVALADAARYAHRSDVASQVLLAERARFAGSAEAKTAAFLLGRLAEDAEGAPGRAVGYYDQYLAEAPNGAFASEALGRKMNAVNRTAGAAAARSVADEYLRRFPSGSYAAVARRLAGLD